MRVGVVVHALYPSTREAGAGLVYIASSRITKGFIVRFHLKKAKIRKKPVSQNVRG